VSTSKDAYEIELLTRVASLYYLEDETQAEIASRLGFSRPKVARLLRKARMEGIVEIAIRTHPALNMELESTLVRDFGLKAAILVADQTHEDDQRVVAARALAEMLTRTLQNGCVVAVGMGRNVSAIATQVASAPHRECTFVSAIGGSPQAGNGVNPNEICVRLAERYGGQASGLFAPAYADSPASRRAFLRHADVQETLDRARSADYALVGIGDARDDSAVVRMGCFSTSEMVRMRKAGAVGDILGYFFDAAGHRVKGSVENRVVGLEAKDLRSIPQVIAISAEAGKARAVLGALRTGVVNVLVTSVGTAQYVVDAAR
jgi:DNA-binding transcriptional regulator LsrR (DeoR family)